MNIRKTTNLLLAVIMLTVCGCKNKEQESDTVPAVTPVITAVPEITETPGTPYETAAVEDTSEPVQTPEVSLITLEEYRRDNEPIGNTDGGTVCELMLDHGEKQIYGWLYVPKEDRENYPLVIICHGFQSNFYDVADIAGRLVDNGIAAFVFDFCGGSTYTLSSGDITNMSVLTERDDLNMIMDELFRYEFFDRDHIYLAGESQGGMVAAMTAAQRPDDVSGLYLLYPAFVIPDMARQLYGDISGIPEDPYAFNVPVGQKYFIDVMNMDVYEEIKGFNGRVMIKHGDMDTIVPVEYSEKAASVYDDFELEIIPGEGHGFHGETREYVLNQAVEFVRKCIESQ